VDPSLRRRTACAPGPVRISSFSPIVAPASSAPSGRRYSPPLADTTVARGPPGAIHASMLSRPRYRTEKSTAAAATSVPHERQPEDDRAGIAITRRSPFISAGAARPVAQRRRWSSRGTRVRVVRLPLRYERKSGRSSAHVPAAAVVSVLQTLARAAPIAAASTDSCFISRSASSSRSSDIAGLLLTLHLSLQPLPDAVEPDGDVVLLEPEFVGQLLIRQPLDVAQQEQRGVVIVEGREGTAELFFQQQRRSHGGMRRPVVVRRLGVGRPAAQEVDGRVDGRAPEVGRGPRGDRVRPALR